MDPIVVGHDGQTEEGERHSTADMLCSTLVPNDVLCSDFSPCLCRNVKLSLSRNERPGRRYGDSKRMRKRGMMKRLPALEKREV